jgi:hypothetical protein
MTMNFNMTNHGVCTIYGSPKRRDIPDVGFVQLSSHSSFVLNVKNVTVLR